MLGGTRFPRTAGGAVSNDATSLSDTGSEALAYLVELLTDGFTGEVRVKCSEGGVVFVSVERTWKPAELAKRRLKRAS